MCRWVGLFLRGWPDTADVAWRYLSNSGEPPATGMTTADLTFPVRLAPGVYDLRVFHDDWDRVAASKTITVTIPPVTFTINGASPSAAVTVTPGGSVSVHAANVLATTLDWVGVFRRDAADDAYGFWTYLSGTSTPPIAAPTDATLTVPMPTTPGLLHLYNRTRCWNRPRSGRGAPHGRCATPMAGARKRSRVAEHRSSCEGRRASC